MNDNKTQETKRCSRCGRILPIDNFRFWRKPYYRSECRDCEAIYNKEYEARKKEKNDDFRDNIEMLFQRKYKEIHPARILNLKETGLDIELMGEDEIFVRLMDCSNTWLSNYGRLIRQSYGKYNMLHGNGSADGQAYTVRKPVYKDGEWIKTERTIYAAKTVIETFIVNPDIVNNKRVWHRGNDINDNYYKNLYPLTIEQYTVVLDHYERTGDDSEEYILKVMNDIRFKKKDWSRKSYNPTVCGVGYYPPEIFSMFDKVYILTYMFDASILKYYFDLYKIDYDVKSIERTGDRYALVDYFVPDTSVYRDKVNVYNGNLNDNLNTKVNGLSATWFKSSINKSKIAMLKNNLYNYFQNIMKAKSNTIMWTSFKESKSKLKGKGYSNCHVACNCRSTNEYADRYNLAYCVNIYLHPAVSQFFIQRGIEVDQDMYALSEMIQWIWRSRIRNGESINIYVPSKRMRGLLLDWLAVNSEEYRKVG
ncbi:MAG: hypothetical protein LUI14_05795 [Lachnospiraceae bacterium]|nr:hypothetical protein [Lachnospiraceae bacterium]